MHSPDDVSLESDGGIIHLRGKTEELGEKPVPVPLCPPQIPYGLTRARIWPATNDLSHGTPSSRLLQWTQPKTRLGDKVVNGNAVTS
jgi:hypothetical protein